MKSRWTDAALITGCAALLIIGIFASVGVFNFIGTTNAAYLSYGMYAGAALFLIIEIVKVVLNRLRGTANSGVLQCVPADYKSPTVKHSEPLSTIEITTLRR